MLFHFFQIVAACSIMFQIITAINFARMTKRTPQKLAWILVSIAVSLMVIRRIVSLHNVGVHPLNDFLSVIISIFLFIASLYMPALIEDAYHF
jgi:hypothetical protein